MRQLHALDIAGRGVGIERERRALDQGRRIVREPADAQFWALQVDEHADRPPVFGFDGADRGHQLAHALVRSVAHVDAEHVGAGFEQARDHAALGRRGAQRGDDLGPAQSSHQVRFSFGYGMSVSGCLVCLPSAAFATSERAIAAAASEPGRLIRSAAPSRTAGRRYRPRRSRCGHSRGQGNRRCRGW